MSYILTPSAESDIENIWLYIAQESPEIASNYLEKIKMVLDTLAEVPTMGKLNVVPVPDVYFHPFERYNIYYQVTGKQVEILRIRHSAQDPSTLTL